MELILLILLGLHLLLGTLYALDWYQDYGRLQEALIRLVFALLFPFLGFLFCKLIDYFQKKRPQEQMDELYLGHGEMLDELDLLRPMERQEEIDKAPAVDTLRTGEYHTRRKMIMDTLKEEDTAEYLPMLREALLNEDMETSHYASTVIMDLQKRIQTGVLEKQRAFERDPQDPARQEELEEALYQVIESKAFDENNLARYYALYSQVSNALLEREDLQPQWLHRRVAMDLRTGENIHAKETASRYLAAFPQDEDAVVDVIQVCLCLRDRRGLDRLFARLGEMPVVLTQKSLQYIRFIQGRKEEA